MRDGAVVDYWRWAITEELYEGRMVLKTPPLGIEAAVDPCGLLPCPEEPFPYASTGAPTGYQRKARSSKNISPLVFSVPWPKEPYCCTAMPFLIPPPGLPVSLDCENALCVVYSGDKPEVDGGGAIWRGPTFSVPVSVAVVDVCGRVLYDAYVQPHYRPSLWTDNIHGITERTLRQAKKRVVFFHDARAHLAQILANRPVYGVGIAGDLDVFELSKDNINAIELSSEDGVAELVMAAEKAGKAAPKGRFSLEALYFAATGTPLRTGRLHYALDDARAAITVLRKANSSLQKLYDDHCHHK